MDIKATIKKVEYKPYLCNELTEVPVENLGYALEKYASCILELDSQNKLALSRWVSAKRTRSYPYARVYDTLSFSGRKVTIIPIYKDEGVDGDRDFIQWDTLSLMSLLGVYVIIGYYADAIHSPRYANKITRQRYDVVHISEQINDLRFFQSDALHWNLLQAEKISDLTQRAFKSYREISNRTSVMMHSEGTALNRIAQISLGANEFKDMSRKNARAAQNRESCTEQPKEQVNQSQKAILTIKNYLGGEYFFTADEAWVENDSLYLIECKHSKRSILPSRADIKDGLIKMVLFSNLDEVVIGTDHYQTQPVLRLTSSVRKDDYFLQHDFVKKLLHEAEQNHFEVRFASEEDW